MQRTMMMLVAMLAAALFLGACGDDDDSGSSPNASATAEATKTSGNGKKGDKGKGKGEKAAKTPEASTPTPTPTQVKAEKITKPQSEGNPSVSKPAKSIEECLERGNRYGPDLRKEVQDLCNADPAQALTASKPNAEEQATAKRISKLLKGKNPNVAAATKLQEQLCKSQLGRRVKADARDEADAYCEKFTKLRSAGA